MYGFFGAEPLQTVSLAVIASWLTLAAGGGWRPGPGRGVGWAWLFLLFWDAILQPLAQT